MSTIISIIVYIIGLLILYKVIELAVINGINKSNLGIYFTRKFNENNIKSKKSFLDDDLDH
ncbi:hypothetical protein [Alkalihalobacillus trypoxylicola]|uniref:Uncharacterized protein n=1 Tax=Alkalihalobacillus trypoxylicola TaxID=519424 RepID=A0A161Q234_9BACI|nr:hypothetical protein [Alkalihalobacillus trypoxylicola]KYG29593.1 hypothetical protein AZF04_08750 [Alkalihalobacillus trypoxylicola]